MKERNNMRLSGLIQIHINSLIGKYLTCQQVKE